MNFILPFGAIIIGAAIGYVFGAIQHAALLYNKRRQENGNLKNGWILMPGSMGRVAILMVVMALVQVLCPIFFDDTTTQWLISVGVVLGYGWTLLQQLRQHSMDHA